ncbi:hypothetical protein [Cellulomonas massiliensis]|uniref:hypothetical protein n=1 Tax=Cellulomonas massiliensis TaxID=1465811 RepID=UPI0003106BA0|nr:hypothetical protein [Cellulomonas massiliensis]
MRPPLPRQLAAAALAVATVVGAGACSSSAPARLTPSTTAAATPAPTATLLPTDESTGSAVGELPDGFPAALVPVPPGAEVLVATVDPVPGSSLVAISLNVRTTQSTRELLAAVEAPLLDAGFEPTKAPTRDPALAARSALSGPKDQWVMIGVLDTDDARTMTLSGQVRADDA